jgi:hypothetical protein
VRRESILGLLQSQVILSARKLGLDPFSDKLNPNGGALASGPGRAAAPFRTGGRRPDALSSAAR